ncbi:enoyl-CoA hydratase-related protein [Branchiibius sp. NY16-3462-2]|uniref:enoyl-CoA hydratase-related protein n=1 Tax=Branchiibius sp. NY16-3462-2 TaxID=1807500 RepID=UPI00079B5EC2|nr:enoyl-CoA hydratase-related protein [Branchiibius sp. NY16-3462-2]KYH44669.1 hypothetical protein AZH51_00415 [Branchiibius sp. NY16-3462-2]
MSVSGASILRVSFGNAERLHAVTADSLHAVADAIERAGKDPQVRVIVIHGDERSFSAGADLSGQSDPASSATLDAVERLIHAIRDVPRPVVALARGAVAGVGVSIALATDLVLCDEDTYFLLAFTRIGLMPDGGATALVAASIGRARAMRMALLAEKLTARDAYRQGLIAGVYEQCSYDARTEEIIEKLLTGPAAAYAETKRAINAATLDQLDGALEREATAQVRLLGSNDFAEGVAAFYDKRSAAFRDQPPVG